MQPLFIHDKNIKANKLVGSCTIFFLFVCLLKHSPLFAPKAPRLIKGAHNNTVIRLTHKSDRHKQHTKLQQLN